MDNKTEVKQKPRVRSFSLPPADFKEPNWKLLTWMSVAIALLAVLAHAIGLGGQLVFNDQSTLAFSSSIHDWDVFWSELWAAFFTKPLSQQWLKATYAWDMQQGGMDIVWYHTVNLILHMLSGVYLFALVFRLCWRFLKEQRTSLNPYYVAWAAAALFVCHPLTSESVAYISARMAPLQAANYLLALNLFLAGFLSKGGAVRFWGYALSAVLVWIGVNISAEGATLPFTILFLIALLKPPSSKWMDWVLERGRVIAVLLLWIGIVPYLTINGMTLPIGNGSGLHSLPAVSYAATQFKSLITYYARCFVLPFGLSISPPLVVASDFTDPFAIVGILAMLTAALGFLVFRHQPLVQFGLFLFFIGFIPTWFLVQPEYISDRRFYFSLLGLCLLTAVPIAKVAAQSFRRTAIILGAGLLVLVGLSCWRGFAWNNNEILWQSTIASNAKDARAHAMLSLDLLRRNKVVPALTEAKTAVTNGPSVAPAFVAVGGALLQQKDYQGAADAFQRALELCQQQGLEAEITSNTQAGLAEAYLRLNKPLLAAQHADAAVMLDENNPYFLKIRGESLLKLGRYQDSYIDLMRAGKMNPYLSNIGELTAEVTQKLLPTQPAADSKKQP
jgi:protein O-mannosyl-transferase